MTLEAAVPTHCVVVDAMRKLRLGVRINRTRRRIQGKPSQVLVGGADTDREVKSALTAKVDMGALFPQSEGRSGLANSLELQVNFVHCRAPQD